MKLINIFFIYTLCLFASLTQVSAQKSDETIIWKALKDEVKRNMDSLNLKNGPKTCFISVTLDNINSISINSELGSIVQSNENKARSLSYRLLVGSYKLNDENFTGLNNNPTPHLDPESLPIDNDYNGIRRTFWAVLDNSYRTATKNYLEKIESLKTPPWVGARI